MEFSMRKQIRVIDLKPTAIMNKLFCILFELYQIYELFMLLKKFVEIEQKISLLIIQLMNNMIKMMKIQQTEIDFN